MKVLITGSAGRIGSAIFKYFQKKADVIGLDLRPGPYTTHQGDINNQKLTQTLMESVDVVVHVAALLTPHVDVLPDKAFHRVNIAGTQQLLNAALKAGIKRFVFTSTTSVYGCTTRPKTQAVWVTETLPPHAEDIYDRTKLEAEVLCQQAAQKSNMQVAVLRMSRCFPEPDHLILFYRMYRGVDQRDVAAAHYLAATKKLESPFEIFNISAAPPFQERDCSELFQTPWATIDKYDPRSKACFLRQNWPLPQQIDRVYSIGKAQKTLNYQPQFNYISVLNTFIKS